MRLGQHHSGEAKELLRKARAKQIHPALAARGITQEMAEEALRTGLRWCSGKCKAFLPVDRFTKGAKKCSDCKNERHRNWRSNLSADRVLELVVHTRIWRQDNPDYDRVRDLLRKYDVTPEWYAEQLRRQDGHCALCPAIVAHPRGQKRMLFVDHCHATGKVRGILCAKCNTHLGILEADPSWPEKARAYLASSDTPNEILDFTYAKGRTDFAEASAGVDRR